MRVRDPLASRGPILSWTKRGIARVVVRGTASTDEFRVWPAIIGDPGIVGIVGSLAWIVPASSDWTGRCWVSSVVAVRGT
jgi:hypothetical protein